MTTHAPHPAPRTPRRRRRFAAAAVAASAIVASLGATVPAAGADTHASEAKQPLGPRLQAVLDRAMQSPDTHFPGVALRVRVPGQGTWSGAAGTANLATKQPMRPGDRFRAGSIMKPFVAAATLQLVEEGKFSLDAPLSSVLPSRVLARFPEADRITVRMLLNHTSGLAEYGDAGFDREVAAHPRRRWTVEELLDRAAALPPTSAPGAAFGYNNTDYNLLGLVLEQATGKSWRTVVRERVIRPLHLRHTSLPRPGRVVSGRDIAHGYQQIDGRVFDLTNVDSSMAGAAGGNALLTTTQDLSRFLRALLDGRLFQRPETLKEMRAFLPTPNDHGRVGYGLGLERYVLPGGVEIVGHMGTGAGYRAFMFHLPAQHIDLAMVTNSPDDPMPVLIPALKLLVAEAS